MKEYFSKENLGMPSQIACILAVLAGLTIYESIAYLWVTALIAVVVYSFNFTEKVQTTLKQSITIGALLKVLSYLVAAFNRFILWFDFGSDAAYKVLNGFTKVLSDVVTICAGVLFAILLLMAATGKNKKIEALDKVTCEKPVCPSCGVEASASAEFCSKCGAKLT